MSRAARRADRDGRRDDRQRDRVRDQLALAEVEAAEAAGDELDVAAALAFAETALTDAARPWEEAPLEQKQRLQPAFFPEASRLTARTLEPP